MGGVETARKGDCHADRADSLDLPADCPAYRVQDDKAAVTENRDGDDPAHEHHGQLWMAFTYAVNDDVGQPDGGAGAFQDEPNQGTEDDDDADAGEGPGKTGTDDARDFRERQVYDDGQQERCPHQGEEWMDLPFGNRDDHEHDCQEKCD